MIISDCIYDLGGHSFNDVDKLYREKNKDVPPALPLE